MIVLDLLGTAVFLTLQYVLPDPCEAALDTESARHAVSVLHRTDQADWMAVVLYGPLDLADPTPMR